MSTHSLTSIGLLNADQVYGLLRRGHWLKQPGHREPTLAGKTLAMIFTKASTRTRVSFEVGMFQLGGHAVILSGRDTQIGRGEPVADTARVLSRYVDGIMIRTFAHEDVEAFARYASVPVINGLTDLLHPCQVLADLLTCRDEFGEEALGTMKVAWIGDGNNMAHSWIHAAQVLGFELSLACPEGYMPAESILQPALDAGARITCTQSAHEAAQSAHMVTTDVWASMGQETEAKERERAFADFMVDAGVMAKARPEAIFLHCLPAHRGEEVSAEVIDGPQSRIFLEAENRLHIQKAILEWTMGGIELA